MTDCTTKNINFQDLGKKKVQAIFDGGNISSNAGALILRELENKNHFIGNFSDCFIDYRNPDYTEHSLKELLAQRIFGLCLGYEDLNDHDDLRFDPLLAAVCNKIDPEGKDRKLKRDKGKALAGKSTLNRLETAKNANLSNQRYKKICYDNSKIESYFIDNFLNTYHTKNPKEIIIDLDATDDRVHGNQENAYFHGYYGHYCYLPLYIFCEGYLLQAKLRPCNIDASSGAKEELERITVQIREKWHDVRIIVRGDGGFCRNEIMTWCEENNIDYIFGLAKNERLKKKLFKQMKKAKVKYYRTKKSARFFKDFKYRTIKSWPKSRRVVGKAEHLEKGENPRFVVTSLPKSYLNAKNLYEKLYCARGEMENKIKEQQLYLFADRTSSSEMRANQLRLYFSSVAYIILNELRIKGLKGTELEKATCNTIKLKLLKIGGLIKISVRRIMISFSQSYPYKQLYLKVLKKIQGLSPPLVN